jgi:ribosome-binding factor A
MGKFRKDRVSELLVQAISEMVRLKIKDPRVQGVTITGVKMSADIKSAIVFFSSLADGKADEHKKGLEAATGYIRRQLRSELDLKYIPELQFIYDTSFDVGVRIDKILKEIGVSEGDDESEHTRNTET